MPVTREPVGAVINPWGQRTSIIHLTLQVEREISLQQVDAWLTQILEIALPVFPERPSSLGPGIPDMIYELGWRYLLLFRDFLQIAGIPIFDLGSIVSIRNDPASRSTYRIELLVPEIANLVPAARERADRLALQTLTWSVRHRITPEHRQKLFDAFFPPIVEQANALHSGISSIPFLHAAHALDIPVVPIGGAVFQFGWGRNARLQNRALTHTDPQIGAQLSNLKTIAARYLRNAGIPVPDHSLVTSLDQARDCASRLGWPVVVKPEDLNGGIGITVAVDSIAKLEGAFALARKKSGSGKVIIERQHKGLCHRIFIFQGELLFANKRMPIAVCGDGKHSIAQLVDAHNGREMARPPWIRTQLIALDQEALEVLRAQGLDPRSVPEAGIWVDLRWIESTRWGGRAEDVTHRVHPENAAIAIRSTELFGLTIGGIDLITTDISVPWYDNGAIICEVNTAPMFGNFPLTRPHVKPVMSRLLSGGDGRIPIFVMIGGRQAETAARSKQRALTDAGIPAYLTTADATWGPNETLLRLACSGLAARCQALAIDRAVGAVVIVVPDRDSLPENLIFDRFEAVEDYSMLTGAASVG